MSRTIKYYPSRSRQALQYWLTEFGEDESLPPHKAMRLNSLSTPANSFRRMWRRSNRAICNRALSLCVNFDDLQVPDRAWQTTSLYDWY